MSSEPDLLICASVSELDRSSEMERIECAKDNWQWLRRRFHDGVCYSDNLQSIECFLDPFQCGQKCGVIYSARCVRAVHAPTAFDKSNVARYALNQRFPFHQWVRL